LIEVPLPNRIAASEALGFAAAVAEFGMLLRDSEHKGTASFSQAAALARQFRGADQHGHRAEFIRLIDAAEGVTRIRTTAQQ
jgi:Ca-activated chloride channel family protein